MEHALNGKFKEAKLLFEETIKEDDNFAPAYNNLGIIYELFYDMDRAFEMYSRACIIEPGNDYYRRNFLYSREKEQQQ